MRVIRTLLTVLPIAILLTASLRAQPTSPPPKEVKRGEIGAGVHLSISSFIYSFQGVGGFRDDPLPIPQGGANVRYNAYQGIVEYARDNNESLLRITARYNFEMNKQTTIKAREYAYGGIDLWYFSRNEEGTFRHENNYSMNRPSGQSKILGFNGGLGIELRFWHLGLFIEAGIAIALCSERYNDFICGGAHTTRTKGAFGDYRLGLNTHF